MGLGGEPHARHVEDLVVGEHSLPAVGGIELDTPVLTGGPPHDLEGLGPHPHMQDAWSLLVHHVGVRFDLPAHDDLALTECRLDHDVVAVPGRGIDGEHHP